MPEIGSPLKRTRGLLLLFITLFIGFLSPGCGPSQEELTVGALTHFRRGNQLYSNNDPRGAIEEYRMAIAMDDQQASFYFNMGLAYYRLVLYSQAIESYRSAIALDPDFGDAWYNLSLALDKIGETDKAFMAYEKYQAINASKTMGVSEPEPKKPVVIQKPETPAGKNRRQ